MKFNNGYFGACIVVLAMLGTASAGFFLNVDQDTREVTNYNYTADISGLFDYSDAPEYIAYNPSTNLNGYSGDIVYTPSTVVNNYRYMISEGTSTTQTLTVSSSSDYPGDYGNFQFGHSDIGYVEAPDVRFLWNGSIDFGSASTIYGKSSNALVQSIGTPIENSKIHITKLTNVLASLGDISNYGTLDIAITYNTTYPVLFYSGAWETSQVPSDDGYKFAYYTVMNENNSMPDRLVIENIAQTVTAYRDNSIIWTNTADKVGVLAWYSCRAGGYATPVTCSVGMNITLTEPPTYGYMNPNAGVKVSGNATWSNGYRNSIIDLKIIKNGDASIGTGQQIVIAIDNLLRPTYYLPLTYTSQGFYYQVDEGNVHRTISMGAWLGVSVRIDGLNGDVILTPTNDLNLLTTVEPTDYSIVLEDVISKRTVSSFSVQTLGSAPSLKFQVTDTVVFLNTYNTVMVDPSLRIVDYFPDYTDYRINFYSFAILGNSITINNQVMPVNKDNATITFTNVAGFEFTKPLANFFVTFHDGHTYLTFVNDNTVYDLGETRANDRISFSGMWYFTTGLYKGVTGNETYWDLDLDGMFHATAGECLIVFIGIIGAGIILYTVWGRGKLGYLDWLVIIISVFLGGCLLGF